MLVKLDDGLDDIICLFKVSLCDIDLLPQFDFVLGIHFLGFLVEVLFGWRKFASQPHLVNNLWNKIFSFFVINWNKILSLIEGK